MVGEIGGWCNSGGHRHTSPPPTATTLPPQSESTSGCHNTHSYQLSSTRCQQIFIQLAIEKYIIFNGKFVPRKVMKVRIFPD